MLYKIIYLQKYMGTQETIQKMHNYCLSMLNRISTQMAYYNMLHASN